MILSLCSASFGILRWQLQIVLSFCSKIHVLEDCQLSKLFSMTGDSYYFASMLLGHFANNLQKCPHLT